MKNNPMTKRELNKLETDMKNFKKLIEDFLKHKKTGSGEEHFHAVDILSGIVKLHRKYILNKKGGRIKFHEN